MKFFCVQRRIEPQKMSDKKTKKRDLVVVFLSSQKKPDFFNKRII